MKIAVIALGAVIVTIGAGLVTPLAPKLFPALEGPIFWTGLAGIVLGVGVTLSAFVIKSPGGGGSAAPHIVSSRNQSGGITAHTVHMAPPQRSLQDPAVREGLQIPIGKLDRTREVEVAWPVGDAEAGAFAEEIALMLERQNGTVSRQMWAVSGAAPGVQVYPEHNRIFVGPRETPAPT